MASLIKRSRNGKEVKMMKRRYFVEVEARDSRGTYDEFFLSEAEEGKEKETFLDEMKRIYGYEDEGFVQEGGYFDRGDIDHSLAGWSEVNDDERKTLKRWFIEY
jgi:hypothetical protein